MRLMQEVAFLALGILAAPAVFGHEERVIVVGRNVAGALKINVDFAQPAELRESVFPEISGYATAEMAFHSTAVDEPEKDFYQLSTATDFRLVLLAKDPGMELWNDTGSGYMGVNDSYFIGAAPFDNHPIWNIVSGTPGNTYSLTLKLRDLNGIYPETAPFVLSFTPITRFALEVKSVDSQQALLSWPTNAVGWKLQAATSMAGTWSTVTNVPNTVGTNFSLSVTTAQTQQFYRLHKH